MAHFTPCQEWCGMHHAITHDRYLGVLVHQFLMVYGRITLTLNLKLNFDLNLSLNLYGTAQGSENWTGH